MNLLLIQLLCLLWQSKQIKKLTKDKIGNALTRLVDEDPTLTIYKNTETGDLTISGVGELHLDVAIEKLLNKFGVTAKLYQPAIAYRETIRGTSKVEGKHKNKVVDMVNMAMFG